MEHLTPDDFERHLQQHGQNMADLAKEVQGALAAGNPMLANATLSKYQTTLRVQERLNLLSSRLTSAAPAAPVAVAESVTTPRVADTTVVTMSAPHPRVACRTVAPYRPQRQNFRYKHSRISSKANRGLYLQASALVVPIWTVIARLDRTFYARQVKEAIRTEMFLRAPDLEVTSSGKARWEHMFYNAFGNLVRTNRTPFSEGKANQFLQFIDIVRKDGRYTLYTVNDIGRAEMNRVLSNRNIATPPSMSE